MITPEEINDLFIVSTNYSVELGQSMLEKEQDGCDGCSEYKLIQQIFTLEDALAHQVEREDYGEDTDMLYNCLLNAVSTFSGAAVGFDTNASVQGITLDVTVIEDNRPNWIDVFWEDMVDDSDPDGKRVTYYNEDWIGLNPMIQIMGVVMYQVGIEYENDGLGTITFNEGYELYEGQYFRAGNYQDYTPPPPLEYYFTSLADIYEGETGSAEAACSNDTSTGSWSFFTTNENLIIEIGDILYIGGEVGITPCTSTNWAEFVSYIENSVHVWFQTNTSGVVVAKGSCEAPPVEAGEILLINNSSLTIQYNDNFGGLTNLLPTQQFNKNPLTATQEFLVTLQETTKLTYEIYEDGVVIQTNTYENPPFTGQNFASMVLTRGYYIVVTDI